MKLEVKTKSLDSKDSWAIKSIFPYQKSFQNLFPFFTLMKLSPDKVKKPPFHLGIFQCFN